MNTSNNQFKDHNLDSLSLLIGGIAHDFNNILTMITGNLSMSLLDLENKSDLKENLENALKATFRASKLTKQLLQFSIGKEPIKESSSIIDIVRDSSNFILSGSKVKVIYAFPTNIPDVHVDPNQISQVIQNIVLNAKQAMSSLGLLKISIIELENYYPHQIKSNYSKWIKISISDNGPGISQENIPKVMTPYFTTKNDGTGLGLSSSFNIVKNHNGYLEFESKEGEGTSFYIYLPVNSRKEEYSYIK